MSDADDRPKVENSFSTLAPSKNNNTTHSKYQICIIASNRFIHIYIYININIYYILFIMYS